MAFQVSELLQVFGGDIFQIVAMGDDFFVLAKTAYGSEKPAAIGAVWTRDEMIAAIGRGYFRRLRTH